MPLTGPTLSFTLHVQNNSIEGKTIIIIVEYDVRLRNSKIVNDRGKWHILFVTINVRVKFWLRYRTSLLRHVSVRKIVKTDTILRFLKKPLRSA